ncbi:sugar phosphate isomerase/epimerase family protein [Mucilaginibacter dorajii]|uniref:Sugar phosphate isomerase/epimerase n=1 Tax=Mucilaginibacter dorajii TaxID=692994 RepID=A0ABP7R569_9SPHI|nr:sugar phosphate isomerase/epimerase [Mucilaginibacter dorajii]MCS3738025.1 sugar phosphate isomerase/epimerase [Mucilaginibacter dorajii]
MTTRRTFLAQAGLLSAGVMLAPQLLSAKTKNGAGLQLYSLRDQLPSDVKGVIGKVAKAGYKEVETFGYNKEKGYWGLPSKDFGKLLKDNGLSSPSGHYGIDSFLGESKTEELNMYMEVANTIGQTYIIIPSLNHNLIKTVEDCKHVADRMNKAAEICKTAGLKLGYHNHNFEWAPVGDTTFYDVVLNSTDPKLVNMEMDLYWVVRAGQDPIAIFEKHPGRFKFVHIKDRDKTNPNLNTEIGTGDIDFVKILSKAKLGGVEHFIVEQENYTNIDPYVSIAKSAAYLKGTLHI